MRRRLEQIGEIFLAGCNRALIEDDYAALTRFIGHIDPARRGFAVEGAAMGAAIADALTFTDRRLCAWMTQNDTAYTYLAHVGAGWALARAPWRKSAIMRQADAIHGWLVFDGVGFHDTYFNSASVLAGWRRLRRGYAVRAYDQGIGRALWFVAGGDIARAAEAIRRFDDERRADLWSGLGLALAYVGGAASQNLSGAVAAAGRYRANLAQGAAFAAEAHARARFIPTHTRDAVHLLAGVDAEAAAQLVRQSRAGLPDVDPPGMPRYEAWRRDIRRILLEK
jgi:enediyne biosynthesis protein E3